MKLRKVLFEVGKWISLIVLFFGPIITILFKLPLEFTNAQLTKGIFIISWFLLLTFIYFNVLIKMNPKGEENE